LLIVIPAPAFVCVTPLLKLVFCPTIVTSTVCPGDALAGDAHATTGVLGSAALVELPAHYEYRHLPAQRSTPACRSSIAAEWRSTSNEA
jgi:hypothetical protein